MTCDVCQKHLMLSEDPDNPDLEVSGHLAECQACRDWQRQLVQIEHNVGRLPVPASQPHAFLDKFLGKPVSATEQMPSLEIPSKRTPAETAVAQPILPFSPRRWTVRRWVGMVGAGLAAAVLLIGGGILLGNLLSDLLKKHQEIAQQKDKQQPDPDKDKSPPDKKQDKDTPKKQPALNPLVASLLDSDLQLAEAESPRQRVEELAKIARTLNGQTSAVARLGTEREMEKLAGLYARVVREGVVTQAKTLPRTERRETLKAIAGELKRAGDEAEDLARTAAPGTAQALRDVLAAAAREGNARLRDLMEEDSE